MIVALRTPHEYSINAVDSGDSSLMKIGQVDIGANAPNTKFIAVNIIMQDLLLLAETYVSDVGPSMYSHSGNMGGISHGGVFFMNTLL